MKTSALIEQNQDLLEEETFDRFSKAEHIRWLNRALEDFALRTGYVTSSATIILKENEYEYPYPQDAYGILKILYSGEPLEKATEEWMDEQERLGNISSWRTATGAPQDWMPLRNMTYRIYPKPDKDNYVLTVKYLAEDDALSDDNDVPHIPGVFHLALSYFASSKMALEDEQYTKGRTLWGEYLAKIKQIVSIKHKERKVKSEHLIKLAKWSS